MDTNYPNHGLAGEILRLFETYGPDFVHQIKGSFTIVVLDRIKKAVHLVCDRFGFAHLYYFFDGEYFIFAPEMKAFLKYPHFDKTLNPDAIAFYLSGEGVWGNQTFFKGVNLLPEGSILTFSNGQIDLRKYYRPEYKIEESMNPEDVIEVAHNLYLRSLRKRLPEDKTIRILLPLSGGLDSRYLLSLLLELNYSNIHLFTHGDRLCRDYRIARDVAKTAGLNEVHNRIEINPEWMVSKAVETVWLNEGLFYFKNFHLLGIAETITPQMTPFVNGITGAYFSLGDGEFYSTDDIRKRSCNGSVQKEIENFSHFPLNHAVLKKICKAEVLGSIIQRSNTLLWDIFQDNSYPEYFCDQKMFFIHFNRIKRVNSIIDMNKYFFYDILPFVDDDLYDLYLTIPHHLRMNNQLYHAILKRKSPKLSAVPWAATNVNLFASDRKKQLYSLLDGYKNRVRGKLNRVLPPLNIKNHARYKHEGNWAKSNNEIFNFYLQSIRRLKDFPLDWFDMDSIEHYMWQTRKKNILRWPHMNMIMKLATLSIWHTLFVQEEEFNTAEFL